MLIEDLQVILKVAEFKSITAAATHLDMRTATASAAVKRVEKMLGTELFIRTTRQLRLSPAGERYVPECQQALNLLNQAEQNAKGEQANIEGEIRIAASSDLGRNLLVPWLDEFIELHPKISVKVNISDSNIDFYRDAVDMALRYGSPVDSNLYGFKICHVPCVLCASPDYVAKHGQPSQPKDLAEHNGLFYQLYDIIHDVWQFERNGQMTKVKVKGNRSANDADLVRRWCVAGKGVAIKSSLDIAYDLLSDKLVQLMPDYQARKIELWLVCPSRQLITPAMRLLRDFLQAKCQALQSQLEHKVKLN